VLRFLPLFPFPIHALAHCQSLVFSTPFTYLSNRYEIIITWFFMQFRAPAAIGAPVTDRQCMTVGGKGLSSSGMRRWGT
jgi:hypothetical protein